MPRGNGTESTQLDSQFPQLQVKRHLPWPQNPALAEKFLLRSGPRHHALLPMSKQRAVSPSDASQPLQRRRFASPESSVFPSCRSAQLTEPCPKTAQPPSESSALQSGDIAMLGWRGAGITKYAGLRGVTQRREHHAVAVLGLNGLSQNWGPYQPHFAVTVQCAPSQ